MRPTQGSRNISDATHHMNGSSLDTMELPEVQRGDESLPGDLALTIFKQMVRTRVLEERSIKMAKSGEAYFWVGGPGEEAFNVCLGMQVHKGHGPAFDYLHLHYRSSGLLLAMGMSMADHVRQMAMRATDPHSMGRNFVGHYCRPEWNVVPVSSVIEVQYTMAPGTAMMQKRYGGEGISIVTGGEAGTSEGDFASGMIWSTRPGRELPVLMIVSNNGLGISTSFRSQHSEKSIVDRGQPFGIPGEAFDGNDPIVAWHAIDRAMSYCRRERRPYMLEARVSRLHGHSSSSGAARVNNEVDCVAMFEQQLRKAGIVDSQSVESMYNDAREEVNTTVEEVMREAMPTAADVERFTYAPSRVDAVYPDDYTGLPK